MKNNYYTETSAPVPQGPAEPGDLAGRSTSHENEERGDIIKFYNTVYVQKMQEFSLKFANVDTAVSLIILFKYKVVFSKRNT